MLHRRIALMTALSAVPIAAGAQAVVIPRPDTLGANFAADHPGRGTPSDYDFLIGKWQFRTQARNPTTLAYGPVNTGTWTATRTHGGFVVEDEFAGARPDGGTNVTETYRVFNPQDTVWAIEGVSVRRGVWQPGTGWSDGRDRFLVQDNPGLHARLRIRYYDITSNHFLWRADGSTDGGRTWVPDVILIEATRVPDH